MYPKDHVILGFVFSTLLFFLFPEIGLLGAILIFLGSFLIDFDHYITYYNSTRQFDVKRAYDYYWKQELKTRRDLKKGVKEKGDFHVFHTLEFNLGVFLVGFLWIGFWWVLIGMVFHQVLDLIYMVNKKRLFRREFFALNWVRKKFNKSKK